MVIGVALINLFVFGVVAFSLYNSFGELEERTEAATQNLSKLLAESIAGDIDKIDVMLLSTADEIERQAASGIINRQALNAFIDRQQGRLPEAFGLRATDAKGIVSYGQGVNPSDQQNNSDREYFTRQRDNPKAGLVIAKPILTRIDKKWAIVLSRPIHLPDGSFGGVVYTNIGLDYLTKTFPSIDVGRRGSISLRDAELNIFAVYPVPVNIDKVIGEKLAVPELKELIQAGRDAGTYITNHTFDGVKREFAVRKVQNYPLYTVVGRSTEEYMARWKNQAVTLSVLALLFCLASLISSWLIYRNWRNQLSAKMELARNEKRVRISEARLQATIDNSPYMIWQKNQDGQYIAFNQPFIRVLGQKQPQDVLGKTDFDLWPKELAEKYHTDDAEVMHSRRQMVTEERAVNNGQVYWVETCKTPIVDNDGNVIGTTGFAQDITERKQAETALKLHKAVIDTTNDGFWLCDTSGYLLEVNQAYANTMGYTREELVGMNISQLSALASTPELVRARMENIIEQRAHSHFETRHRHKDGHIIHFESSNTYLAESNTICSFLRDITERKHAEDVLRESENRFRTLVENSPMCIHEIGMDGRLTSMNSAGLLMMGVKDESAVRGFLYLDAVSAADRERIGELLTKAYAGEASHFEFKSAGQREQIFKSCFVPVMNNEGSVIKLMGITEDITERKAAEEQIRSLAFYDTLTQLPNRRLLNDRLEQVIAASKRSGRYGALMFMDLDNFKPLNDAHGHDVGDLLLVEVARRIGSCVREMDTVARFGGDEFVVILGELEADKAKSTSQAEIIAEKIRTVLSELYLLTIKLEGKIDATVEHHCTASIGVALFVNHKASYDDIIKWADMAMYRAKEEGRNLIRFYDSKV